MEFEFGETRESNAFFDRNPNFMAVFERLMKLGNTCFGRQPKPKRCAEDVCFGLGHACRQDFLEVVFLAANGYGSASSKIIRGLYERAVALAYIVQNPDKAERFVRFAGVQEHNLLQSALKVVSENQYDQFVGAPNTVSEIRERYRQVKPEFEMSLCKKCGTTRVQATWDLDLAAMVHKLGEPYQGFYLPNYTIPNLAIHATLASAESTLREGFGTKEAHQEADLQVACAVHLMILVISSQNALFLLNLDTEIEFCVQDAARLRPQPRAG